MPRSVSTLVSLLAAALLIAGCGQPSGEFKPAKEIQKTQPAAHDDGHSHAKGPHGGSLIELGEEEFHAELVLDHDKHAVLLYLLGPDAKSAAMTSATEAILSPEGGSSLTLKAAEGQEPEKISEFVLIDEKIVHELLDAGFIHGELKVNVGGKDFSPHLDLHFDGDHHDHADMPAKEKMP